MIQDTAEAEQLEWKAEVEKSRDSGIGANSARNLGRKISVSRLTAIEKSSSYAMVSTSLAISPMVRHHQQLQRRLSSKRMSSSKMFLPKKKTIASFRKSSSDKSSVVATKDNGSEYCKSKEINQMSDLEQFLQVTASHVVDDDNESRKNKQCCIK